MKDYFDLWVLAHHIDFNGDILRKAIQATFTRRKTEMPDKHPFGLTETFAQDSQKQIQWSAFLRKNSLEALPLENVVQFLSDFLWPAIQSARESHPLDLFWKLVAHGHHKYPVNSSLSVALQLQNQDISPPHPPQPPE